MTTYPTPIAVVSGDLVGSTKIALPDIDQVFLSLAAFVGEQTWLGANFTRQSGDGWQLVVLHPEHALRSALAVRAKLMSLRSGLDTYISISVGMIETAPPDDLNHTNHPRFVASGRELEILKNRASKDGIKLAHWDMGAEASVGVLLDEISKGWTSAQAEAVLLYLNPYSDELSYSDAAARLGKSRQTVTKSLKAAGKDAVIKALAFLEADLAAKYAEHDHA